MSFLSDLFEGNFGNLGTDLSHTFSSLASHPDELAETLGVGALVAAPFVLPELGAAFGIGGELAGAELGAEGLAGAGEVVGGLTADTATGLATDASLGLAGGDVAALGADAGAVASDVPTFALTDVGGDFASTINAAPGTGFDPTALATDAGGIPGGGNVGQNLLPDSIASEFGGTPTVGAAPSVAADNAALPANATFSDVATGGGGIPSYPTGAAAGAGGGGITQGLGNVLSNPWTKLALGAAPLALTLGMGETQLPQSAQQLQAQALQLQQTGLANLADAQAGKLNAGQTAQIAQMTNNLKNQWLQTLFNQGVTDPTKDARWPQILETIDAQVTAQTAQLIQQNITNALAETGQASTALTQISQMQMTADQNFTNSLVNAAKALGMATGSGSKTITVS